MMKMNLAREFFGLGLVSPYPFEPFVRDFLGRDGLRLPLKELLDEEKGGNQDDRDDQGRENAAAVRPL